MTLLSMSLYNCKEQDNPEKQAEEQNEAKFRGKDERDAEWAVEVALSNMKEIRLAQLAMDHAVSADIKSLAKTLEKDHTAALNELKEMAAKKNITLPDSITKEMQDDIDDMAKKGGEEFDREYADKMVDSHEKSIRKFEDLANDTNDERDLDMKNWANKMLPTLRMHYDQAMTLKENLDKKNNGTRARK